MKKTNGNGRAVLVTGAAGGMGQAVTAALAGAGYRVFALDKKPVEKSPGVFPVTADLTDEESVIRAAGEVGKETDTLFAVLHFAGIYLLDSLVEMDSERFSRIFRVNLFSCYLVNRAFLPFLRPGSRILITTSELAPLDPLPFTGIYAVSKAALDKYAFSLRMELQLLDISVSVLRAGAVRTGLLGASTRELAHFCEKTEHYTFSAEKFRRVVDSVEAKSVPPEKIARKVQKILKKRAPGFAYAVNRNPYLCLLHLLPKRLQCRIIRAVLREK